MNTFTAEFHPASVDRSVLVLNALLGLGTALAPVFVAIFVGLGFWVGLPILAAALWLLLIAISVRLPLRASSAAPGRPVSHASRGIPARFWAFAGFAVLYGWCETMSGNWSQIDLTSLHISATVASLTLTFFWAMVTAGRVLFAAIGRWVPGRTAYSRARRALVRDRTAPAVAWRPAPAAVQPPPNLMNVTRSSSDGK